MVIVLHIENLNLIMSACACAGNICSYTHYIYSLLDRNCAGFITFEVKSIQIHNNICEHLN